VIALIAKTMRGRCACSIRSRGKDDAGIGHTCVAPVRGVGTQSCGNWPSAKQGSQAHFQCLKRGLGRTGAATDKFSLGRRTDISIWIGVAKRDRQGTRPRT